MNSVCFLLSINFQNRLVSYYLLRVINEVFSGGGTMCDYEAIMI